MSNQACCSHSKVDRITIDHPGGTKSERWICPDCSTNFWPEGTDMHIKKRRDMFAAAALTGMLANGATTPRVGDLTTPYCAEASAWIAELLLRELEKNTPAILSPHALALWDKFNRIWDGKAVGPEYDEAYRKACKTIPEGRLP